MQFFTDSNFDFIGRRNIFIGLSIVLLVAGFGSLLVHGGPKLGIDFKGGTLVYVKFQQPPDVAALRAAFNRANLEVSTLQPFEDGNELKIDLNLQSEDEGLATAGREELIAALRTVYPAEEGKVDFNNVGADVLASALRASSKSNQFGFDQVSEIAARLTAARDQGADSGLVKDFSSLNSVEGATPDIMTALQETTFLGAFTIRGIEAVGPKIGGDLQWQALQATLAALAGMLVYIAFRFEWIYGVAAVIAVFHDVLITVGLFSLFDREIELTVVAALLTLVGYSMNDTIVIFDRVRENKKLGRRMPLQDLLNLSVNQTLARTVLTSGLTFAAVLCLFVFGGEVLRGFSFALVVGIIVGTYSSIFIASPILLWWQGRVTGRRA
ncbi:MAG: protein translocase subunit SecF [Acidobacteria bacterium]|nr:protein translocase subunit SecF [Acidobacteriota bacterium]